MSTEYQLRVPGPLPIRAQQRNVLLGNDQRRGRTTHMLERVLKNALLFVSPIARGMICGPSASSRSTSRSRAVTVRVSCAMAACDTRSRRRHSNTGRSKEWTNAIP